jgi:hypothetical protein
VRFYSFGILKLRLSSVNFFSINAHFPGVEIPHDSWHTGKV